MSSEQIHESTIVQRLREKVSARILLGNVLLRDNKFQPWLGHEYGTTAEESQVCYDALKGWSRQYLENLKEQIVSTEDESFSSVKLILEQPPCVLAGISHNLSIQLVKNGFPLARHVLGKYLLSDDFENWFMGFVDDESDARLCMKDLGEIFHGAFMRARLPNVLC